MVSTLYRRPGIKTTVNARRINRESMRAKLQKASFVSAPRLVSGGQLVKVMIQKAS